MTQRQTLIQEIKEQVGSHEFYVKFEHGEQRGNFDGTFLLPSLEIELEVTGGIWINTFVESATDDYPGGGEYEFYDPHYKIEGYAFSDKELKDIFHEVKFYKY